ncbi:MAG: hypothetical protein U5L00_00915 [Desulfovermiculus sp.]|nr:hypothetical protein [Desulfovermiculus sp.]
MITKMLMPGIRAFIDTNVLVYLFSGDAQKADQAENIIRSGAVISVQVLNELDLSISRPFRAAGWGAFHPPGRCPGLVYPAPSGPWGGRDRDMTMY